MTPKRVRLTPQAERDLDDAVIYLSEEADAEIALRFYDASHATFRSLLEMPGLGRTREMIDPHIVDVRQSSVYGFEKYLIFYRIAPAGIVIIRVLHGARDIDRILNEET